ncbi:MAG: hypothetical protein JWR61_2990 [Ferruginibacter sp.]|uniref:hypothetical protein n=1 Tax=Ferruginibacter sp. TaxID=1940288 RepID=UPI002659C4C6|nr:hypothetical protein [Ferruginibacter sp.]MDB5278035.1 hypothetical protein [Ferruginibacter sp.]
MKKILTAVFFFATLLLLNACKKDSSSTTSAAADRVKTYTIDVNQPGVFHETVTCNVSYDDNNRIAGLTSTTSAADRFVFSYPSANKFSMDIFGSNVITLHEDSYINGSGLLDSTFQYNDTQDTSTEKYIYNTANQLVTFKEYYYSAVTGSELNNITTSTYNADGDLVSETDTDNNRNDYEYYTDQSYVSPLITGLPSPDAGKKHHLVKKQTVSFNGTASGSVDYTYTFDSSNRISTQKLTGSDGSIAITTYTYF